MAATNFNKWRSSISHTLIDYLQGLFSTSAGHDHDGVNSKLVVGGTPTDGSVTTAKLADDAVTTAKIANDAGILGTQLSATAGIEATQLAAGVQTSLGKADTAMQSITAAKLVDTGLVQTVHHRCTIAEINAGHEILPAVADVKYRLVGAEMIAIGGAVTSTSATGVGIAGTQSAAPAVLTSVAKASLTENTWVNALGAGTILAAGASLTACDANTAITAAAQGDTDLATATHVDVILHYVTES